MTETKIKESRDDIARIRAGLSSVMRALKFGSDNPKTMSFIIAWSINAVDGLLDKEHHWEILDPDFRRVLGACGDTD